MVKLSIHGLQVALGGRTVLHGIDARLEGGSLIGVIGPNGAGKSTLARAALNLIRPRAGRVELDDIDVAMLRSGDLARRMAYLPQGHSLHWPLSVERLVALGRLPHLAPFSRISPHDEEAIRRAMQEADVLPLAGRVATELSGGERARVLLARALAVEAGALIVDEPLAALDPGHQLQVMELLRRLASGGVLTVAVMHDLTMAARFCDRLLLLDQGCLVADGLPEDVLTPANLREVYGIEAWRGGDPGHPLIVPLNRA